MEYSNNSIISDEFFNILIISLFIFYLFDTGSKYFLNNFLPEFIIQLKNFWINYNLWIIGIIFLIFIYILYRFFLLYHKKLKEKIKRDIIIEKDKIKIKSLLKTDIEDMEYKELVTFKNNLIDTKENFVYNDKFIDEIDEKIDEIDENLPIEQKIEENYKLDRIKREIEKEIRELKNEKRKRIRELEEDNNIISKKLQIDEKNVFKIKGRTKKEINVLKMEKYKTVNEYCVYEQKVVPTLIKKVMNHSKTHIFLVWSVKKLLNSIPGIINIKEHYTRDADLTFEYFGKKYSIEVETGSLTRKPRQMAEKKAFLNKKYKNRWFVVISNRNLLQKYKNFGIIATRKDTIKVLKKMIKLE